MKTPATLSILTVSVVLLGTTGADADGLVVGVPYEDIGSVVDGGAINVLYGNSGGLTATDSQMWNQDTAGIPGMAEQDDRFGQALASGDFNGDGHGDLAIGVPWEGVGDVEDAGLVHVLYADGSGTLTADGCQWWYQGLNGLSATVEEGDGFASSLAAGDFNGDGFEDLAVGVSQEDLGSITNAGAVHVIYGSASGLTSTGNQFWTQDSPGVWDDAEESEGFGDVLATGDFDGDGFHDLAIGVPFEEVLGEGAAGTVHILFGSEYGLTDVGNQQLFDPTGVAWLALFGHTLAVGDLNGDARDDLCIGSPNRVLSGSVQGGTVTVLFGSSSGLSVSGFQTVYQGANLQGWPIWDDPEAGDWFGGGLAVGDYNGDGRDDLAVSAASEDLGAIDDAGVVHIIFGAASGLTGEDNQYWSQDLPTVWGSAEEGDMFGRALAAGDFNNDGYGDLAVGVIGQDVNSLDAAGLVHIFYGSAGGPVDGLEVWSQDSDIPGGSEEGDAFGQPLAVIRSSFIFADGFESGDLSAWSL